MTKSSAKLRTASAGIGLLAVAALTTIGLVNIGDSAPAEAQNLIQGTMQTGVTITKSTADKTPAVQRAAPLFTFTTPEGFAVPH